MIFSSLEFVVFALLFFALWQLLKKNNFSRWALIVSSSLLFYAWWDWRFVFLIVGSGLIDYFAGLAIEKQAFRKRFFLVFSLVVNLGLLSVFKYSEFFALLFEDVFRLFHFNISLKDNIPEFALILPVGISFYTFQSLSYTIDVYRGRLKPTKNILHFFSYLVMFPQLVAGPIIRAKDFLQQLTNYRPVSTIMLWNGLKLIAFGLFQKLVIADNLSFFIDSAYEGISIYDGTLYWWLVVVAFSFQIYYDFSGYSLIARGLAKLMGYHFKMNFNHPYLSSTFKSFWSNWHISLSTWFRDYVYIPLGGSKKGAIKAGIAVLLTFLLSGIWHGAAYTFLIWGALHGLLLLLERYRKSLLPVSFHPLLGILIVFTLTTVLWVFFRSSDIHQAKNVLGYLIEFKTSDTQFLDSYERNLFFLKWAVLIELGVYLQRNSHIIRSFINKNNLDVLAFVVAVIAILFLRGEGKQFIYFQF